MATAIIKDPMIKNTASLINDVATPLGVSMPRITSKIRINIATAGNGITSPIINISAMTTMMSVRWPSGVKDSGEGI